MSSGGRISDTPKRSIPSSGGLVTMDGAVCVNPVPMFPVSFQHPLSVIPLSLFLVAPPCMVLAPFVFRELAVRP